MKPSKRPLAVAIAGILAVESGAVLAQGILEEVVVTAQKREASVTDLGLTVTAFSGDTLRSLGVDQPIDLAAQTPGLVINNTLGDSQPAVMIRGVGLNDFNTNANPGVAVYVDENYQAIGAMLTFSMYDIDRVEVLKGPQGTLYGRNTTGGAVSIFTKQPTEELDGYISGDFGDYDRSRIEGAIGTGLTDSVRFRVSGFKERQREGYQTDLITGKDHGEKDKYGVRGQLAIDFSDTVDAVIRYTYGKDESDSQIPQIAEGLATLQFYYYTFYQGTQNDIDFYDVLKGDQESFLDITQDSVGVTLNADLGFATLTSVTSYDEVDHRNVVEAVGVENPIQHLDYGGELENFSQELRLTSNEAEIVDWIVGLYYSDTKQDNVSSIDVTGGIGAGLYYVYGLTDGVQMTQADVIYDQQMETMAVFAHTEWHLSDTLKLTVGARFSRDDLDYDVMMVTPGPCDGPACAVAADYGLLDADSAFNTLLNYGEFLTWYYGGAEGAPPTPRTNAVTSANSDSKKEDNFSWRLALDYTPADEVLLFGSVSNGVKSHGFHGGIVLFDDGYQPYDPEDLLAYELGAKVGLLDGNMQVNGAVFYYDYEDLQAIASLDPGIGLPNDVLTNFAEAKITGAELDVTWSPVGGLTTRVGASWLDTELKDPDISSSVPVFPGLEPVKGADLAYAPEFTLSALVRYDFNISSGLDMYLQVDGDYSDEQLTYPGRPDSVLVDRTIYNARIGIRDTEDRWEVALYGRNLGDEEYNTYSYSTNDGSFSDFGPVQENHIGNPRIYGLNLQYNFF